MQPSAHGGVGERRPLKPEGDRPAGRGRQVHSVGFAMFSSGSAGSRAGRFRLRALSGLWWLAAALSLALFLPARAAIQFDAFLGYDGIVPEACWFPVVFEIKNDGPGFNATVELSPGNLNQGQTYRVKVELPTGTLKRLVVPVFSSTRGFASWDARLLDDRGKLRAEQPDLRPRRQIAAGTPLIGALSRTAGGAPQIRPILPQVGELQPGSARLLPAIFPDNPLVLEGLDALYLNSERATDLNVNQVQALLAWLHAGGHLIIAVEQPSDISSSPWLKAIFPCALQGMKPLESHPELQRWLKEPWPVNPVYAAVRTHSPGRSSTTAANTESPFETLPDDFDFERAPLQVAVGKVREGRVALASGDVPLLVTASRGAGRVTALLFSPEREPVRSWKNLPVFWARLAEVPGSWYVLSDFNLQGGWGTDGIFGAMLDSRQVHKLPLTWLFLLLIVYLAVIGPLDHYWLKRIGKPMLTWITFPCYVVLFSLLIYLIGYKLRAGESEWNELQVVDLLEKTDGAELRGRTYVSIYSPSNEKYTLVGRQQTATLRGEFRGLWSGGQNTEKVQLTQAGETFQAEVFVPVWTSQLLVSDWWQSATPPVRITVSRQSPGWTLRVDNRTDAKLTDCHLAFGDRLIRLGEVGPRQAASFPVRPEAGVELRNFVLQHGSRFQQAVQSRQYAFGDAERGRLDDLPNSAMGVTFLSYLAQPQHQAGTFVSPPGLDLSPVLAREGTAVFLAWASDYTPVPSLRQFTPKRGQRHTLWRAVVEMP